MTQKSGLGSTVLGWFIVQDGEGSDRSGANAADPATTDYQPFTDTAVSEAAQKKPIDVFVTPPPAAAGGKVDFDQVFDAAGVTAEQRERVGRTLDLLNSLPPGSDDAVKKQIVTASLRAFGVPVEQIIEAGAQEIQALEAYIRGGAAEAEKHSLDAQQLIEEYEAKIKELRSIMQQRVEEQTAVVRSCNERKLDIQKVLEFFGQEAVARVVRDSPNLHSPESH